MAKFGTAGNSRSFYDAGFKASVQAPAWLAARGLDAYEYAAGRGVALSDDTARAIGEEARRWGISVSIHAPYYINCAAPDLEKREKSFGYIMDSARVVTLMGGTRVVFHPGSEKGGHDEAMERALEFLRECIARLDAQGYSHINLCPETMGKCNTLGTLDDVIALCGVDARVVPTLDFAHIHARGQGALNTEADFERVLAQLERGLWPEHTGDIPWRLRNFHAHFSHVQYAASGERKHVSFADEGYGPDFGQLARVLARRGLEPTVICESRDTQTEDAAAMRDMFAVARREFADGLRERKTQ